MAAEQEKLQKLCPSAFGALTPVLCLLVHLMLDPEGENDADIGRDNEVVDNG